MIDFKIENSFTNPVIGLDEVGRGPLAGPVVSCACVFFDYQIDKSKLKFFDDSKKLSNKKRIEAFKIIYELKKNKKITYTLGYASVFEIDNSNILEATKISMIRAIKKLKFKTANLLIDGNINLKLKNMPSKSVIRGDQKSYSIATASIIAKIHRDRYMNFISKKYPGYLWTKNAGYGTKEHISQIKKIGITIHHRKSFEPIKSLIHK